MTSTSPSPSPGKILVTGASGFVGRALCRELSRRGFRVRAALRTAIAEPPVADEIAIVGDVHEQTDWRKAVNGADVVVHLAARVHRINESNSDSVTEYMRVNVQGTKALAIAAAEAGVKRLVFLSSVKVNGERTPTGMCFTEMDAPAPQDEYGRSKLAAEYALAEVASRSALEYVVIRPPLVYGPGVGANFLRLMRAVQRGWPLPFGAVANARSMIYLGNLLDAIATCSVHPHAAGQSFLVSDAEAVSTPELIRALAREMNRKAYLFSVPSSILGWSARLAGIGPAVARLTESLVVDASRIRGQLDWVPPYSAAQGRAATIAHFLKTESGGVQERTANVHTDRSRQRVE